MNMKLFSHGFLFHRNINRRENKEYISDVQQKIIQLHKLVKWLQEKSWSSENPHLHHQGNNYEFPMLRICREEDVSI